jgi:uncharacterized membrane protein YfhO
LIVNQNFDPGWHASRGTVLPVAGLLAVDVEPGERELTLKHRPEGLVLGLALTALGAVLSIVTIAVLPGLGGRLAHN